MKKLLWIVLCLLVASCNSLDSSKGTEGNKGVYISEVELFDIKTPHFCYVFLEDCSACSSIKGKIELYALEHDNFYMLKSPLNYSKGISKEDSLGARNFSEIFFVGFPTLIHINKQVLDEIYVGVNEICNVLN